jgi:hypothetical protein
MTIIYYDETKSKEEMYEIVQQVKEIVKDEVICMPKNFDILLDCSLDQLISVKGVLDTAISMKIQMESPATEYIQ